MIMGIYSIYQNKAAVSDKRAGDDGDIKLLLILHRNQLVQRQFAPHISVLLDYRWINTTATVVGLFLPILKKKSISACHANLISLKHLPPVLRPLSLGIKVSFHQTHGMGY